jgi:flagellar biogenesis protein FliO
MDLIAQATKPDMVAKAPASPVPVLDLLQMLVALGVVFALVKWGLPKVVAKMGARLSTPVGSAISVEESAAFGGGQLSVVSVRGRTLLLAVSPQGVTCLADLTEQPSPAPEQPAFFEVLDSADPAKAVVHEPEEGAMSMDEALSLISTAKDRLASQAAARERLDRIIGG